MSLSVTVGVVLVGLLYSFCLAFQWINGWPDKPGYKKYIEALKPRRIYGLTLATLDLLKYLQYGRLYFQLRSWYEDERNLKYYEKGITFGRRGNKLDLYHPPNAGKAEDMKSPVVVFIYGGAWSTGERSTYCLLGRQMAEELKATVICPDYCTYPKGNVLGMVQDITDCLIWAHQNGEKFNFDKTAVRALLSETQSHKETILSLYGKNSTRFLSPGGHCKKGKNPAFLLEFGSITFAMLEDNIVLVGHSAGAHLCTLVTLFLVGTREELLIESNKCQDILLSIRGIIGLSGVYNIVDHYEHEQKRAVEYVSPMHKAMNGVENFPYYSPAHVLKKLRQDKVNRLPPFVLLHGTNDIMVPVQSTTRFSELLTSRSAKVSLYVLPGVSHTEILTDLMVSDRRLYHPIYRYIKQEYRKLLSTC